MNEPFDLRLTRQAARDLRRAAEWWEINRPLAPGAIAEEFKEACELLRVQPEIGSRAMGTSVEGVRRFHLSRIHYFLYYRVRNRSIEVLALWHTSRGSSPGL